MNHRSGRRHFQTGTLLTGSTLPNLMPDLMPDFTPKTLADRNVSAWTRREQIGRLLWAAVQNTLFRLSPHPCNRWRRWLLIGFGAKIGKRCTLRRTMRVEVPWNLRMGDHVGIGDRARLYSLGVITLEDYTTVSQYAHLCAGSHDHSLPDQPLIRAPITVRRHAWIAADAYVGPDVEIATGALLGARSCAFKNLEPWTIYGGNPAKPIKTRPPLE